MAVRSAGAARLPPSRSRPHFAEYEARKARLQEQMRALDGAPRLGKTTTNLFRRRGEEGPRLDVRSMNHVLDVDAEAGVIEAEGMTTYAGLVDAVLAHGLMPTVVPELQSITIGGALAGIGIESSSFRYGLVHDTVEEYEVLLADGEVVLVRPDNEHADLYYGFPNTFGSLGYALRVRVRAAPVKPYVRLHHQRFTRREAFFEALAGACAAGEADFVEGEVMAPDALYLSTGRFVEQAPATSDYSFEHIYYRSIPEKTEDHLAVRDYIWRWDTDWFWCSRATGAQHPLLRKWVFGRERLNSVTYMKLLQFSGRWSLMGRLWRSLGYRSEPVIQDVPIPVERAAEFLAWFHETIGILPVWCCPVRTIHPERRFEMFPMEPGRLYVNCGFWDVIRRREAKPASHYNRLIEAKVRELGGLKSLYSDAFYEEEEFWRLFDGATYARLKERYDPDRRLKGLYEKCVTRP